MRVTVKYPYMCSGSIKFLLYIKTFARSSPQKIKNILKTKHVILEIEEEDVQFKGSSDPSYFFFSTSIFYDIVYTKPAST